MYDKNNGGCENREDRVNDVTLSIIVYATDERKEWIVQDQLDISCVMTCILIHNLCDNK